MKFHQNYRVLLSYQNNEYYIVYTHVWMTQEHFGTISASQRLVVPQTLSKTSGIPDVVAGPVSSLKTDNIEDL